MYYKGFDLNGNELIIDAIFGTGLNKPITGIAADTINFINESEQTVVSIDIPSGLFSAFSSPTFARVAVPDPAVANDHHQKR